MVQVNWTGWYAAGVALLLCAAGPARADADEKQRAFEWVFGEWATFDPAMVQKVLNDTHGKRHYVDKDGDGKPEEVWFIDIASRHNPERQPLLVRVIDLGGNLRMGEEPDYAGYLYLADWNATGTVDAALEYNDLDGDGDVDEMIKYFYSERVGGLRAAWIGDEGDDNRLMYDIDYMYYQTPCQTLTHFGGDEAFSMFYIRPGEKVWTPFSEMAFLFWDRDGDGVPEETMRVAGEADLVYTLRHSFDLDNSGTLESPRSYDVSMSAYAQGVGIGQNIPFVDPNIAGLKVVDTNLALRLKGRQVRQLTIRGIPTLPILRRNEAPEAFRDVTWARVQMTWNENDLNVALNDSNFALDEPDVFRWEGVIGATITNAGFEFPKVGGPSCGQFNKRYELVMNPTAANAYYFSPADGRIHIKHSDRTWINVDLNYDRKTDMYYLWTDTDGDGILDKIEVDVDGDGIVDDSWTLDVSTVIPVQWNFRDLNRVYAPVIVNETPLVYQLNRTLQGAAKKRLPDAEKPPAWQMIEDKMRTEMLTENLSEKLLNSDASMLYYMRLSADYEIARLKKAHPDYAFWETFDTARGRNDLREMTRLLGKAFKVPPAKETYADWVAKLRAKPAQKKVAWNGTWFPPNWGWESEKAAFRFYDGHFDLFGKLQHHAIPRPNGFYKAPFNLFGKPTDVLIFDSKDLLVKTGGNYHKDYTSWGGMDILHVGKSGGCGGIILYADGIAYPVVRNDGVGPTFKGRMVKETLDTVTLEFTARDVGPEDTPYTVRIRVSANAGRHDAPVEVTVTGKGRHDLKLGLGMTLLPTERYFVEKRSGVMGSWGFQDPEIGWVGLGVIFPAARFLYMDEQPHEHRVVLRYSKGETLRYHIRGDWLRGHQFPVGPGVREWRDTLLKTALEIKPF